MYNSNDKLNEFYDEHVRLKSERKILANHRDVNLDRLKAGLDKIGYPRFRAHVDQGSFAMFTINQHPTKDYDIDIGIIFDTEDLPSSAYDTRQRILEAINEGGGNFTKQPEAKTNAVRVYYAEGHHVDMAIYRIRTDSFGKETYEHAGSEWTLRDPMEITNWFNEAVSRLSPSKEIATVEKNQLRRVVRWLKAFAKSRETWKLPGGLILSVLAEECYQPDCKRDDIALYLTMNSILNRLNSSKDIYSPVNPSQLLSDRAVDQARINKLKGKLELVLDKLMVLQDSACTEKDADNAWHWVFQHPFWSITEKNKESIEEMGKRFGQAAITGSLYVTQTGQVHTSKPINSAIQPPPQKFFGDD